MGISPSTFVSHDVAEYSLLNGNAVATCSLKASEGPAVQAATLQRGRADQAGAGASVQAYNPAA